MNVSARKFEAKEAVRGQAPLLMGIMSPSGGGKTYSALRLAMGMQEVMGGDIYGIDTENGRMLHYADQFKFKHVPFSPPFGSLDYLAAIRFANKQGGRIIIVDSMTHEHIGEGGYLETAEAKVTQVAGPNASWKERQKVAMLGWADAGPKRQKMIEGIKQLDGCFIFCFRAKEKTKPVKKADGGTDIVDLGFMPIAGEEWVYEMAVNCMLEPRANGVPTWRSDHVGERMMMKLPEQFKPIFAENRPLDETIGRQLATWAKGGDISKATRAEKSSAARQAPAASDPQPPHSPGGSDAAGQPETEAERIQRLDNALDTAAKRGTAALETAWKELSRDDKQTLKSALDRRHKATAKAADDKIG